MVLGSPRPKVRQLARLPAVSLSAAARFWPLATLLRPPTRSALTPLLEMNSTDVGRTMLSAVRLPVRLLKDAPVVLVPHREAVSAT